MSQQPMPPECPKCGCRVVMTERRPGGFNECTGCGYKWLNPNFLDSLSKPSEKPTAEQTLITEIQKITLAPGDDLIVKLRGMDIDEAESLRSLKAMLEEKYPENRVLCFFLPEGTDIDFSIIKKI